ncbi:MAG TPA: GDSL-type esterase/lipase family protein [Solirubrobacterales bacterium]|nr:GDSL-type esterase/lipase family protein [Solirubrobacterales bacterium]
MSRIALVEAELRATNPASFAVGAKTFVVERGGGEEDQVPVYSAEEGGVELTQPLICDEGGRPKGTGDVLGWVDPGRYDRLIDGQRVPWDAAAGGSLPVAAMEFKGAWNAATNTPKLADGSGNAGDVYRVTVGGNRNLGSGVIDFQVGDDLIYDGAVWFKVDTTDAVASVNGKVGAVSGLEETGNRDSDAALSSNSDERYPTSKAARSFTRTASGAIGRRLMRVLKEGLRDCTIVIVGDSTSTGTAGGTTWSAKLLDLLHAQFPAYTIKFADWDDATHAYPALTTKYTGTGSVTLTLWNCAIASKNAHYQQSPYFDAMVASKQPDLVFISHGHNHGAEAATVEPYWRDDLLGISELVNLACPRAEVVLFAQNPRVDGNQNTQALRQHVTEMVAQVRGYGFVNVHRLFLDVDPAIKSLLSDEIHPNATGYLLIAEEVFRLMNLNGTLRNQQPSSLSVPVVNLLSNGDFASYTVGSPDEIPNWFRVNVTASKDTTNYEGPNGYAVKLTVTTPGSAARLTQALPANLVRLLRGGWICLASRVYGPAGRPGGGGRISINEEGGSGAGLTQSNALAGGDEGFKWEVCARRIAANATGISIYLNVDPNGTAGANFTFDRATLAKGILPRDIR